ncbi:hypothetical protein R5W24_006400 [Gemmata sp. JC717]|uniref:hypothetical protein n=1 Tax=Gemmata algarum TaxID=2975278 RepID=UPI0021BAC3E2|nr:hypothetical protein [Gemmata algarum]MDY3557213.1 hypothetical protein [Gemmata algarum]
MTINAPTAAQGGGFTFDGAVNTLGGAWTAGAQAIVKVTNKAGGTAIPAFFGQVNVTQTAWGPTGALTLAAGKYSAVVELTFKKGGASVTKTALVEFEVK